MEARQTTLFKLLDGSKQYAVPIYQRSYSWEIPHCKRLINDLKSVARRKDSTHFIGSIVYVSESARAAGTNIYVLIDGQQRLTTLSLLILALVNHPKFHEATGLLPEKVLNQYIRNSDEDLLKDVYLKLRPTRGDLFEYRSILKLEGPDRQGKGGESRVSANYNYFQEHLDQFPDLVGTLWGALEQLDMVYIQLERNQDDPQAIFESLNSTGKDLSQTDLIRNFVLMDQTPKEQARLHGLYWEPIEKRFADRPEAEFDEFSRAFVATKKRRYPLKSESYEEFKRLAAVDQTGIKQTEFTLKSFAEHAKYFAWSNWGCDLSPELESAFQDTRSLKMSLVQPLFMRSFEALEASHISIDQMTSIVRLVESYLARRMFTSQSNNSIDNTVAVILDQLKESQEEYYGDIQRAFLGLKAKARFPRDAEVLQKAITVDFYSNKYKLFVLGRLENSLHPKEPINFKGLTIEHVMPQRLSPAWMSDLGQSAQETHTRLVGALGNLTLTGYNAELSNLRFNEKKSKLQGGYGSSIIQMNRAIAESKSWGEREIVSRTELLTKIALNVWQMPELFASGEFVEDDQAASAKSVTVRDLVTVGLIEPESILVWNRPNVGTTYYANITSDGLIKTLDGEEFDNPSAAIFHSSGLGNINGWGAWRVDDAEGQTLAQVRDQFEQV
jgi:hypothetical protein